MSKALKESLKMDLPALADLIRAKGRGRDTILAHITPREAALLKKRGGSGTINPDTGLPEFEDFGGDYSTPMDVAPVSPVYDIVQPGGTFTQVAPEGGTQYTPGAEGYAPTYSPFSYAATQGAEDLAGGRFAGPVPAGQALPTGGTVYAPTTLSPTQLGQVAVGQTVEGYPGPTAPTAEEKSTLDKLGLTGKDLTRMGLGALLTGGLAATNISRSRQAQQQAGQTQAQQQALATPYQQQGAQQIAQAQAGQLTPQSQAAYQAAQARINQQVANRGGVGVQQASNELAQIYQGLLANQYQLGQQIMNIGDQYALGAIKTGLQANQAVNQANQNFYQALAQMAAPFMMGQAPVYQVSGAR